MSQFLQVLANSTGSTTGSGTTYGGSVPQQQSKSHSHHIIDGQAPWTSWLTGSALSRLNNQQINMGQNVTQVEPPTDILSRPKLTNSAPMAAQQPDFPMVQPNPVVMQIPHNPLSAMRMDHISQPHYEESPYFASSLPHATMSNLMMTPE